MEVRHLALVRDTEGVDTGDLTRVAAALQSQVIEDFAPVWDLAATVDAFVRLEDAPVGHWPIIVRDDIPYDAQGIHLHEKWGPYALVKWSEGWSLTASHECLEMLADPQGDRLQSGLSPEPSQGNVEFLVEVCDPSEAAQFAYNVDGTVVSDFYFPSYFLDPSAPEERYSYTGAISQPRQVLQGGYLTWRAADGHWWQQTWFGGAWPEFVDLGAKPSDVTPRRFTDSHTTVPREFMTPKQQRGGMVAATGPMIGTREDKAQAIRADLSEIAGIG